MKRLILIAGPSCAGKTTFIASLLDGNPELKQVLCVTNPSEWVSLEARQLDKVDILEINNLILHYDVIEQYTESSYRHISELFANYEDIIIITLFASPFFLLLRNTNRLANSMFLQLVNPTTITRGWNRKLSISWQREKLYITPGMAKKIHVNWTRYIDGFTKRKHLLYTSSGFLLNTKPSFIQYFPA